MFMKGHEEVMEKHYNAVTNKTTDPVPLYLPDLPADSNDKDEINVGQDLSPRNFNCY